VVRIRALFSLRPSSCSSPSAVNCMNAINTRLELHPLMTKSIMLIFLLASAVPFAHAEIFQLGKVQLICHRTANRDMPENTLEALVYAARMGCNVVELDIRRTLEGKLVLNHDGYLERLTGGIGDVELTSSDELELLEVGTWMGRRFAPMRIPSFDDALDVAREQGIGLMLDIKEKGEGPLILEALQRHAMLERVVFGGESEDVRVLYPAMNPDRTKGVDPGCTAEEVSRLHEQGFFVIANFSANAHEMDMPAMRAAVAAGVDAINVDYPRLGADAVGRPVEAKINALARAASNGTVTARTTAIRELSQYEGFPTQRWFEHWLRDGDDQVSRAAAVALVRARPQMPALPLNEALSAPEVNARRNAAWALGMMGAPATASLLPLLGDKDSDVVREALLALSRCPGDVPAAVLLPFLSNDILTIRSVAALALARHQPEAAATAVPALLKREEEAAARDHEEYVRRGSPKLTQQEIDPIVETYREQMKLVQALEYLTPQDAFSALAGQAFRSVEDYSLMTGVVAGYQLWDRISANPALAIQALGSPDRVVADRAEWMLVKAGPPALPAVREALRTADSTTRQRLIRIIAWQGDSEALAALRDLKNSDADNAVLIDWAVQKIHAMDGANLEP
jgi:glycerophosphoryl diester phosphodiesterase/HEAT repeat protein